MFDGLADLLGPIFSSISDGLSGVKNGITNIITTITNNFNSIIDDFNTVLSFLNPFSDDFFLKVFFIPSDGFIDETFEQLKTKLESKLGYGASFDLISDALNSSDPGNHDGITKSVNLYGAGTITANFLNLDAFNSIKAHVFGFIRGLAFFLIPMYHINKVFKFLGYGSVFAITKPEPKEGDN